MKLLRKAGIWTAILLAIVGGLAFVVVHFNVHANRITSGSMTGTLPVGSIVISYKTDNVQLDRRDIITFRNPEDKSGVTTHTYLGTRKDGTLITHGDANLTLDNLDNPPRRADVVGKVILHVDVFTTTFWKTWRGVTLALGLAFGVLAWWLLTGDAKSSKSEKGRHRKEASNPAAT